MNEHNTNEPSLAVDEWGELLSAHLDGETTAAEAALVEQRLANDPAARRLADEMRSVSRAVKQTPAQPAPMRDLSAAVVAEGLRRQAAGEGVAVEPAERLEPAGEFGLPFERSSGRWVWAGVAVAAAVLIGFYGKPAQQGAAGPQIVSSPRQIDQALTAMRRTAPGLQVVNYQATPQTLAKLRQRLALQHANLPSEFTAARKQGVVVEPVNDDQPLLEDGEEQLIYVDADPAELDRLLEDVKSEDDGEVYRVEADSPAVQPSSLPARRLRLKLDSDRTVSTQQVQTPAGGRRVILLRIRLTPRASN